MADAQYQCRSCGEKVAVRWTGALTEHTDNNGASCPGSGSIPFRPSRASRTPRRGSSGGAPHSSHGHNGRAGNCNG